MISTRLADRRFDVVKAELRERDRYRKAETTRRKYITPGAGQA